MSINNNNIENSRIAKNTILLYIRMLFLMAISLYTSRAILQILGVEDFGIYNVVGGFISLFGILNTAIGTSTSRYITFAIGKGDKYTLKKVFSICVLTHFIISIIILILAETIGLWFVINKLSIPEERFTASIWVYQSSIISAIVMILSVPYNADIIAHEKMSAFAYISIFEAIAKLCIVYILLIGHTDRLILFALLNFVIQMIIRCIYSNYCIKHFEESKFTFIWDKDLFQEILSFSSWNLLGSAAGTLFTSGVNVLLNMFFGPSVNAARGIATQIQSAVGQFSLNFQTAINPQITKCYASGELNRMHTLINRSTKFTFMLLLCISLPVIIETYYVLELWLGQVPNYTIVFIRIMLCISIVDAMANPLMKAASSNGNVKKYQIIVGGILLSIVPLSYIVLKLGGKPESVFIVHLCIALFAFFVRIYIVKPLVCLPINEYIKQALLPCVKIAFTFFVIYLFIYNVANLEYVHYIIRIALIVIIFMITSYFVGLTKTEKIFIVVKIQDICRISHIRMK